MIREIKTYEEEEIEAAQKRVRIFVTVVFIVSVIMAVLLIASCDKVFADEIDMAKIAQIESSGCKFKVGDGGNSNGCHQVSMGVLKEYNQFNRAKYTKKDLMNDAISLKVASWYMNKRIPQMLKHYGIPDTTKNRLWAYNAGIGNVVNGRVPQITKDYFKKYGV